MPHISNQVVVVTGGTRGIGLEFVSQLLQRGNTVVATGRDPEASKSLQLLKQQYGEKLVLTKLELAESGSIAQWAEELKRANIAQHIDVLVNNAAVSLDNPDHRIVDFDPDTFTQTLTINALGPLLVVKELIKQGLLGGRKPSLVVHVSSFAGSLGKMGKTPTMYYQYSYRASKSALNMLVLTSANELPERNITSVLLHPGRVLTDMLIDSRFSISPQESVTGQLKVLEGAEPFTELNGKFLTYTGEVAPW